MAALSNTDQLTAADKIEIHELTSAYGFHHDQRDFDSLRGCFTPGASYVMRIANGPTHGPHQGVEAIVNQIQTFKRSQSDQRRHHISNIIVTPVDADTATVSSYVLVSAVKDGQMAFKTVGTYRDTVTRTADGWRILHKALDLETTF